jgi:hypothetical protein
MNRVIAEHPNRIAVLALHDYLRPDGTRSATGNKVFEEVVVPNRNVAMVLSGHYTGSSLRADELDDDGDGVADRKVFQMLNDYQGIDYGGLGYLKLLHFDKDDGRVYVNTYSPTLDDYNYYEEPGKDEFTLSMDLTPRLKRVATDTFVVMVYTDRMIGSVERIASGETAAVRWSGLEGERRYDWYALAEDEYGGRSVSDVWTFATRKIVPVPERLRVTEITDTSVGLAWDPVEIEPSASVVYDVYVDSSLAATVTDSVYSVRGLQPDTEYTFFVVAKDGTGASSEPSDRLTVKTRVNLDVVQTWTERYAASGDLRHPLAVQLLNSLDQANHHKEKGRLDQAIKKIEDFLKHLDNKAMEPYITTEAKERLNEKANELLEYWSIE